MIKQLVFIKICSKIRLFEFLSNYFFVIVIVNMYFCARKNDNFPTMSGQLKEVRLRIQSVSSTQQITKAMKMVSAAKLRKAQDAVTQMRPYAQKLQEMLSNIVSNSSSDS